jgi:hypothetical protein
MTKVLSQPWGGLGDNLQFSTLPELYVNKGFEFRISCDNHYRNDEIHELVWGTNPYVAGWSTLLPNAGDVGYVRNFKYKSSVFNFEHLHGFVPKNTCPKLYYKPNFAEDFRDVVFADLSAISQQPVDMQSLVEYIHRRFPNDTVCVPMFKRNVGTTDLPQYPKNFNTVPVESLFQYCDLIWSSKRFICSFSGSSVLASALKKRQTTCVTRSANVSSDFVYPNISYHFVDTSLKVRLRHFFRQSIMNGLL